MPQKAAPKKRSTKKPASPKSAGKTVTKKARAKAKSPSPAEPIEVTRAVIGYDEDDVMLHGGGSPRRELWTLRWPDPEFSH